MKHLDDFVLRNGKLLFIVVLLLVTYGIVTAIIEDTASGLAAIVTGETVLIAYVAGLSVQWRLRHKDKPHAK